MLVLVVLCSVLIGCASMAAKLSDRYTFRNLKSGDIAEVASLCAEVFEGPFNVLQFLQRSQATNEFRKQISDRFQNLVVEGKKHSMLVVADVEDGEIVGFVECGLLPPPPVSRAPSASKELKGALSSDEMQSMQSDIAQAIQEASQEIEEAGREGGEGGEGEEVPYLGNVAVKEKARRQGIGRSLILLTMKLARKASEEDLYVIVDATNRNALALYDSLGFVVVLDERDLITRGRRTPRVFLQRNLLASSAGIESEDVPTEQPATE